MTTQLNERVPQITVGWRIRMAMESAGIQRSAMAAAMGISPAQLSRITRDQFEARRAYLLTISEETGVSLEWLLTGNGTPPPEPPVTKAAGDIDTAIADFAARKRKTRGSGITRHYLTPSLVAA